MCRSAQSSTLSLWSGRPTTVRTQGVRPYESAVVVRIFLIGCVVLLLVFGCAGTRSETSNKKEEQGSSPKATASEEARCEGTQTLKATWLQLQLKSEPIKQSGVFTTNDLPWLPQGQGRPA